MREYELVYILKPDLSDGEVPEAMERVSRLIAERGGAIQQAERWGRRRLAYPIRRYLEGTYVVAQIEMEPSRAEPITRALDLSEEILRHLLVRKG